MVLHVTPELGVPIPDPVNYEDLRVKAQAACETALLLEEHGLDLEPSKEDRDVAATLLTAYAADPVTTSKAVTNQKLASIPPATVVQVNALLKEFSHAVVSHSTQIRQLVTNKLIIESENPDPRVRIRALELLGKISDVGLFTEKQEITVTHQSTDELKAKLKEKLAALRAKEDVVDVQVTELDADADFGEDQEEGVDEPDGD
jgi:hypothetical protein